MPPMNLIFDLYLKTTEIKSVKMGLACVFKSKVIYKVK